MKKAPEAFRTISEVADMLDTPAHVLRFWESKFYQIRPVKRAGGRRYYRPDDIALINGVRILLQDQGLTIRGVQRVLHEQGVRHVVGLGADLPILQSPPEAELEVEETDIEATAEPTTDVDAQPVEAAVTEPEVLPDPGLALWDSAVKEVADSAADDLPGAASGADLEPEFVAEPLGEASEQDTSDQDDAESGAETSESVDESTLDIDDTPHARAIIANQESDEPDETGQDLIEQEATDETGSDAEATHAAPSAEAEHDEAPMSDSLSLAEDLVFAPRAADDTARVSAEDTIAALINLPEIDFAADRTTEVRLAAFLRGKPRGTLGKNRAQVEDLMQRMDDLLERMSEASGAGRW
ncbi:MAG: MerR family transcriptional regulator [Paracoccaceae bacterium]